MKQEIRYIKSNLKKISCSGYTYEGEDYRPFLWHSNDCYELYFQEKGIGKAMVGDYYNDLKPDEIYLLAPKLPHSFYSPAYLHKPFNFSVLFIEPTVFDYLNIVFPEFEKVIKKLKIMAVRGLVIKDKRGNIPDLLKKCLSKPQLERVPVLLEIIISINKNTHYKLLANNNYKLTGNSVSEAKIDKICNYLEQNYLSEISNDNLAKKMYMSRSTLQRFFKKSTGMTITHYVNDLRIGHSAHMLTNTEKSITQIIFESGFNTVSNFNRIFRKIKNCTPSEFRASTD